MQDNINFQHKEHRDWMNQVDFYQEEISIFQKELTKVLLEYPNLFSIIEHVDEYSRILMKKLEQLNVFRRQITLHERHLAGDQNKVEDLWEHEEMRFQIKEFVLDFEKMKKNFRSFVAKHINWKEQR